MSDKNQVMQAWAIPLSFKFFGKSIGDHTWVASDDGYCEPCLFGLKPSKDRDYCNQSQWYDHKYTGPKDSRKLHSGKGSSITAECMAGKSSKFLGIPSQSGIVYAINGVCHNLANRTLYPSKVTVEGAKGYWLIQQIFGVYGTHTPIGSLIPPIIYTPFPIPNPLYLIALLWDQSVEDSWNNLCMKCGVSSLEESTQDKGYDYLRKVQELYLQPIPTDNTKKWTAKDHFSFIEANYKRHMQEVDLTLEYRGDKIASSKITELRTLLTDFHKPIQSDVEKAHDLAKSTKEQEIELNEKDTMMIASSMNEVAAGLMKKAANILGPKDFETYYGVSPEEPILIINPDILNEATSSR